MTIDKDIERSNAFQVSIWCIWLTTSWVHPKAWPYDPGPNMPLKLTQTQRIECLLAICIRYLFEHSYKCKQVHCQSWIVSSLLRFLPQYTIQSFELRALVTLCLHFFCHNLDINKIITCSSVAMFNCVYILENTKVPREDSSVSNIWFASLQIYFLIL